MGKAEQVNASVEQLLAQGKRYAAALAAGEEFAFYAGVVIDYCVEAIFSDCVDELLNEMRVLLNAEGFDMDGVCDVCTVTTFVAKKNAKAGKKIHDILDMILAD